jgi:hypothetical protein
MHRSRRIAICGASLFMQSIQAALSHIPDLSIVVLDNGCSDLAERLSAILPDLVILEKDYVDRATTWAVVYQGIPLLELTPLIMVGRIFRSEQLPITTTGDLLSIITDQIPEAL